VYLVRKHLYLWGGQFLDSQKYYLVKEEAMPKAYLKVIEAKRLLSTGAAQSASKAANMAGISRSAFYKYKDSVFIFNEESGASVITVTAILTDETGVLSQFINKLYSMGANILTINQGTPQDGAAAVTVSYRTVHAERTDKLLEALKKLEGVISVSRVTKGENK
jgi:UPF0735 ACT domain-containing protein cthe_1377